MSIFSVLSAGNRALQAAGAGINVASNNVANSNTEGFAKQSIGLGTQGTSRTRGLLMGNGVKADQVLSTYDHFAQGSVFGRSGRHAYQQQRAMSLQSLETSFVDAAGGDGLIGAIEGLFSAFSELELDPGNSSLRNGVLNAGAVVTSLFNRAAGELNDRSSMADSQVSLDVARVNRITSDVASLNSEIVALEAGGQGAHDLRARRTAVLQELSSLGPTRVSEQADGSARVFFAGHSIVDVTGARSLSTVDDPVTGLNQVHLSMGSSSIDITSSIDQGSIGATLNLRDTILPGLLADIDEAAFEVADQVNTLHAGGFGLDGVTGRDFFAAPAATAGAAAAMSLDAAVVGNPTAIAAASTAAGAPGDNSNIMALAQLGNDLVMSGGTESFTGFVATMLAGLGQDTATAISSEMRTGLELEAALDVRDSMTGVSLEEEALDLLRFQDAYQAAMRVMQTANEMLDELMQLV